MLPHPSGAPSSIRTSCEAHPLQSPLFRPVAGTSLPSSCDRQPPSEQDSPLGTLQLWTKKRRQGYVERLGVNAAPTPAEFRCFAWLQLPSRPSSLVKLRPGCHGSEMSLPPSRSKSIIAAITFFTVRAEHRR
jgi:hypothetical protein